MPYFNFYAGVYEFFKRLSLAWRSIWFYAPNKWYLLIIVFWQVVIWWQALSIKNSLSGELLVLRYKIDFGANLVGEPRLILWYPVFSLIVLLFNLTLLLIFSRHKNFRLLSNILLAGALAFSVLTALYLMSVYLVNFR